MMMMFNVHALTYRYQVDFVLPWKGTTKTTNNIDMARNEIIDWK